MSSVTATDEFRDILTRTLEEAKEPLSASQVRTLLSGPAKKPKDEVEAALEEMAQVGEAHRYPKFRGSYRYWSKPLAEYIDHEILRALADQPQTKSEVRGKLKSRLKDVKPEEISKHIEDLARQGQLQKWPSAVGGRTAFYCARKVEADFYVEHALGKVIEKLKIEGVGKADLRNMAQNITARWSDAKEPEAVSPSPEAVVEVPEVIAVIEPVETAVEASLEDLILERMSVVEPRAEEGALVSIMELRNNLEFQQIPKRHFDEAILKLRRQWRVSLAEHPHVASLTSEELENLVHDGEGRYFNGIAIRRATP